MNDFDTFMKMSDQHNMRLILCVVDNNTSRHFIRYFQAMGKETPYMFVLVNTNTVPSLPNVLDIPKTPFVAMYRGWLQCYVYTPTLRKST